ncbi:MAG TPA: GGDEF domain-containing protein [Anaeromyxobacter sp.]|nr:GGDEF domain-containing protein [Anaeromyxobacter sp.]
MSFPLAAGAIAAGLSVLGFTCASSPKAGALVAFALLAATGGLLAFWRLRVARPLSQLAWQLEAGLHPDTPSSPVPEIALLQHAVIDMDERVTRLVARSRDSAIRDPLTQAFNRRFLAEVLPKLVHQALRSRSPLAVLMIDVDRFKRLNDQHGHDAGDRVLAAVARCLAEQIRMSDTLVRYGGEEFVILLPNTSLQSAQMLAERAREAVARTRTEVPGWDRPLSVTISLGAAALPEHGLSGDVLLRTADQALFRAKAAGRNRIAAAPVQADALTLSAQEADPALAILKRVGLDPAPRDGAGEGHGPSLGGGPGRHSRSVQPSPRERA